MDAKQEKPEVSEKDYYDGEPCGVCGVPILDHPPGHDWQPAEDKPKKPGRWSKLGNAVGEAIGTWFAGRQ